MGVARMCAGEHSWFGGKRAAHLNIKHGAGPAYWSGILATVEVKGSCTVHGPGEPDTRTQFGDFWTRRTAGMS